MEPLRPSLSCHPPSISACGHVRLELMVGHNGRIDGADTDRVVTNHYHDGHHVARLCPIE